MMSIRQRIGKQIREMREAAKRAVENLPNSKAIHLSQPIKAQLRTVYPARLDQLDGVPGIEYKDQTVTFMAENFGEAYNGIRALVGVATRGYIRLLGNVIDSQENSDKIQKEFSEKMDATWVEVESGLWDPPVPPQKKDSNQKYFGYR